MAELKTITEQIYCNIYELILDGTFSSGSRLTMKTLQQQLGVSSSPIREALTRLQQDGLVEYQPNSGVRVRVYSSRDAVSLFTLMSDLDALAMKYALNSNNTEEFLESLRNTVIKARSCFDDNADWKKLSDQFHTTVIEFANNPFLRESLERIYRHISLFSQKYESNTDCCERIQQDHEQVVNFIEQRKYEDAITLYREHVLSSMNEALKSL